MTPSPAATHGLGAASARRPRLPALAQTRVPRPRQRTVLRPELQQQLQPPAMPPLTLIAAPAGFGKTTLASGGVAALREPWRAAWLTLDAHDAGPLELLRALLASLAAALRQQCPGFGAATASLLDAPLPVHELVLQLCDELGAAAAPVVLVLDDYQAVDEPATNAALSIFVDHLPETMRVVLVSRQVPALPLAAWRARGWLAEIGAGELRFSLPEAEHFLRWSMELALPADTMAALAGHAEGWIAGLQMAALAVQARRDEADARTPQAVALAFGGRHRYVADYLAQEVLLRQPPEVRLFLRQTAILQALNPALCNAVTGRSDGLAMLARLDQANMFITRLDDERHWYRFHALFREALEAEAGELELDVLHRRAAAWHESQGQHEAAFHHAWHGDDIDGCARALHVLFETLLCRGEVRSIERLLASLPARAFEQHPELALQRAWICYLTRSPAEAAGFMAQARIDEPEAHPPQLRGRLATFRAYLALNWGHPADTEALARRALAQIAADSSYFNVLLLAYLGQAQVLTGQRLAALGTLRQAWRMGQQVGNDAKALDALLHLALLLLEQGRVRQAHELADDAVAHYRDAAGRPLPLAGPAHIAQGAVLLAAGALEPATAALETGLALTAKIGVVYFTLLGQCCLARALHARGRRDAALLVLARARETAESTGSPRRAQMVAVAEIDLMLLGGHADAAARLHATLELAHEPAAALLQARVLVARRRAEAALTVLAGVEQAAQRDGFDGTLVEVGVQQALAQAALGRRSAALKALDGALRRAGPCELRLPFIAAGAPLAELLAELRHAAPTFIASLGPVEPASLPAQLQAAARCSDALSPRDVALLQLINRGLRNQEIASALSITIGTTKQYLNQLFGKLGVRNRVEAILLGRELKVLS